MGRERPFPKKNFSLVVGFLTCAYMFFTGVKGVIEDGAQAHQNSSGPTTTPSEYYPNDTHYYSEKNSDFPNEFCVEIDGVNIPNAFRAVQAAGDPEKFEEPPFEYHSGPTAIARGGKESIVDSWDKLGVLSSESGEVYTYPGDVICVPPEK